MKHLTHILAIVVATALSVGAALYITHSTTTIAPVEALSEAPVITTDTIRLLFGGDFMQHMPQVNAARTPDGSYDYSRSTEYIAPMFREASMLTNVSLPQEFWEIASTPVSGPWALKIR